MAQKTFTDPIKYAIGTDISEEQYTEALVKISDWFAESRRTEEPAALARKLMQECMDGKKSDGSPWFEMALSPLVKRIRSKCLFDIDAMEPLRKASDKQRAKKARRRELDEQKRLAVQDDPHIPTELKEEQRRQGAKKFTYGDDPRQLLSSQELKNHKKYHADYIKQYPELSTASAQAELNQLCDLHILSDRFRGRLLAGEKVDPNDRSRVGEELLRLKRGLGILPEQIEKRVKPKTETTIAAAAAKLDSMENWREVRLRYWLEEMLQSYQMFHTPSADGTGYQLDELGLYAVTKCRTCQCAGCGQRNAVGISVEEIEAYLKEKGVLEELPPKAPDAGS